MRHLGTRPGLRLMLAVVLVAAAPAAASADPVRVGASLPQHRGGYAFTVDAIDAVDAIGRGPT